MPISTVEDTATIGTTEYSLPGDATYAAPPAGTEQTDDAIVQVWLDLSALQAGDQFVCRLYEIVYLTGATQRLVEEWTFSGAQSKPGWVMPSVIVANGWDVTLQKTSGTDRAIPWSLRKIS